jgi:hypothetical protein
MAHESEPNLPDIEVPIHNGLNPVDLRWFVRKCGLMDENRCGVEGEDRSKKCHGCLGNGFLVDLSSIQIVVDAHPKRFGREDSSIRGPDSPKPWDADCSF